MALEGCSHVDTGALIWLRTFHGYPISRLYEAVDRIKWPQDAREALTTLVSRGYPDPRDSPEVAAAQTPISKPRPDNPRFPERTKIEKAMFGFLLSQGINKEALCKMTDNEQKQMDVHSLPGEEANAAADGTSTFEPSSGSLPETELAREDAQDDTANVAPERGGPILRCLKRIFQKGKKGKTRWLRTVTTVPDISRMETIWEADEGGHEQHGSAMEGAMLLLESWRNTIDYYNSNKEDVTMKKSFLRLLSVLSKTIDWHNMPDFFIHTFASDTVGVIVEMIKKEPRESLCSTIRLQAMATIIDMSKKHVVKALGSHKRRILLRTFLKSVFSLPLVKTLHAQGMSSTASTQYIQAVFTGTLQTLNEMLQSLILENPVPSELERILQLMDSWMQSREDYLRERAVWSSILLLNFVATKVELDEASPFTRLGHLVAVLGIRCGDPIKAVSSKAAVGVCHLISIAQRQKIAQLDGKNVECPEQRNKEFLPAWSPTVVLNSPSRIAEIFGVYFSPREWTDFILTVMDGLTDHCHNNCQPTAEGLLSAVVNSGGTKVEKVADLVAGVCSRLDSVQQPSSQTLMMKLVGLLAGEADHQDTVISCLLEYSFPTDRYQRLPLAWPNVILWGPISAPHY
ncbi:protein MROH8-like [Emydura macquarii macquarii]|uniref:protein MROH8-like n=1 Tax=Emydura macquarii macquarii TaxID=1129001 RepID=UPI00352A8751